MEKRLLFYKTHEWVELLDDNQAKIGISDHAQSELGDIVYLSLPNVGDKLVKGESFSEVESVKAVSDVFSPINGVVVAVNEALLDNPEEINNNPMEAWFVLVEDISDYDDLLEEDAYLATL